MNENPKDCGQSAESRRKAMAERLQSAMSRGGGAEVARATGIPYKLIQRWRQNGTAYPHPDTEAQLQKLCEHLKLDYATLWDVREFKLHEVDVRRLRNLARELQKILDQLPP